MGFMSLWIITYICNDLWICVEQASEVTRTNQTTTRENTLFYPHSVYYSAVCYFIVALMLTVGSPFCKLILSVVMSLLNVVSISSVSVRCVKN